MFKTPHFRRPSVPRFHLTSPRPHLRHLHARTTASTTIQSPPRRKLHSSRLSRIDILDSSRAPPQASPIPTHPTPLSIDEYNTISEQYFEALVSALEEIQEERNELDVEYSAGVLNVIVPDKGTYVLNKQPHNRQIWLSSPLSGPKRFDWSVEGEGMQQKEGGGQEGAWIYLRDGSSLTELLRVELGVTVTEDSGEGA